MAMIDFSKMEGHNDGPYWVEELGGEFFVWAVDANGADVVFASTPDKETALLIAAAPAMKDEILRLRKMLERLARQTAVICEMADAADDDSQCFVVARAILNEIKERQ